MHNSYSHRILTEDTNREGVISILSKYFDSFTLYPAVGYWQGIPEASLTVEVIGANYPDVRRAALEIKACNEQASVLLFSVQGKQALL